MKHYGKEQIKNQLNLNLEEGNGAASAMFPGSRHNTSQDKHPCGTLWHKEKWMANKHLKQRNGSREDKSRM